MSRARPAKIPTDTFFCPGFTVWNLRTYWQLTNQLTLVAGVENFTDKTFREHFDFRSQNPNARSFLQPGRNFYIGTTLVY